MPRCMPRGSTTPVDDFKESRTHAAMVGAALIGNPGTLGRKTFPRKVRGTADPSAAPDFLSSLVGSANFMRLSSMKAAHVAISGAA